MGYCKMKGKKLYTFLFQEGETRAQLQRKAKPKSNGVTTWVPGFWDSLMNFWASKGLGNLTCPGLPATAYTACLPGSRGLYTAPTTVLGGCSSLLAISPIPEAAPSAMASPRTPQGDSDPVSECQAPATFYDPFSLQNRYHMVLTHYLPSSSAILICSPPPPPHIHFGT